MKDTATKYFQVLKNMLPGWSGADIGHSAGRDWYATLLLVLILNVILVGLGAYRFMSATGSLNEDAQMLPTRGFPTSEESILETQALFDARAAEFKDFSERVPNAPDPGRESKPPAVVEVPPDTEVVGTVQPAL